jgi:Rieske Fe-S protein
MSPQPLSRRSALRGLAMTGCGALAGFVLARRSQPAARGPATAANGYGPTAGTGRLLARVDEVLPGGGLVLRDEKIVLARQAGDAILGFSAVCTHQGCPVSSVAGGAIACPCHGSRFDAQTGAVISGPATRSLPAVPVVVRDGGVYTG